MRILDGRAAATCVVVLALGLGAAAQVTTPGVQGLYSLVQRRIPSHSTSFHFDLTPDDTVLDTFTLSDVLATNSDGNTTTQARINVRCTSISACARGLYTYLTQYGGVDIWWTGSRLDDLPSELPAVGTPVTCSSIVQYRYFLNTVTFSYTTAFYSFADWELLLDWMALRGVNLPLAWVGYEHTLLHVLREAGLSDSDILGFFSGPAFQAWNRFGNIQGSWGGELPIQWINDQFRLQKQLLPRIVELGMTPVLPAFTGFVPRALSALYPNASIVNSSRWAGFPSAYTNVSFLEPFDPLFSTLQRSFIDTQTAAYGNVTHIYTLDQYNENDPFSGNTSYLRDIAASTIASLRAADPEAVWMMQGWLFFSSESFWTTDRVQAYLGGVPEDDAIIILDLYSEARPQWQRLNAYYGKRWVWCQLHDFGGNMGFEGNFVNITQAPLSALAAAGNMVGMGLTPEGLEGNEIVYDVLLDQAWSPTPINRTSYISSWVSRRYRLDDLSSSAVAAWQLLGATVYDNQNQLVQATVKSILELEPALDGLVNRTRPPGPTLVFYDTNTTIVPALQMLIGAGRDAAVVDGTLFANPEYRYDLVDVTRQLLVNRLIDRYEALVRVFNASGTDSDADAVTAAGEPLLTLIADLDALLCTNVHFRLESRWLAPARAWAVGANANASAYATYLEYAARNQVTLWGPEGEITDYASKQWGGALVGGYYHARWMAFVAYLADCKRAMLSYNATELANVMLAIGEAWDAQGTTPVGRSDGPGCGGTTAGEGEDGLEIVRALAFKYAS